MIRLLAVTLMVGLFGLTGVAAVRVGAEPRERPVTEAVGSKDPRVAATAARSEPSVNAGLSAASVTGLYRHHSAAYWNWRYRTMRHLAYIRHNRIRQLKRTLMSSPSVSEAINLAAVVYGNGSTLWQLARCESTLNPSAQNPSGSSGLLQFMPSTFASTPYRGFSIWSPYASAMAGGWMLAHGRRSEWVC